MRELGRGGALVAAAVAQLENKNHTRLAKKSAKPSETMSSKSETATAKPNEGYKYRSESANHDSSSSDNEEYARNTRASSKASATASDSVSVKSSERETSDVDDMTTTSDSGDSGSEDRTQHSVLERIADEGQSTAATNSVTSPDRGSNSDSEDEFSTNRCGTWSGSNCSVDHRDTSSSDTTTSGNSHKLMISVEDTSTRCDEDFQWIKSEQNMNFEQNDNNHVSPEIGALCNIEENERKAIKSKTTANKPPAHDKSSVGSLDRRRHHPPNRMERDQKSKSSHNLKSAHYSPSRQYVGNVDFNENCSVQSGYGPSRLPDHAPHYSSFTPPRQLSDMQRRAISYEHFNRRHEHNDPQRYGSNFLLTDPHVDYTNDNYRYNDNSYPPDVRNGSQYYNSRHDLHTSHGDLYYGANPHNPHRCGVDNYYQPSPYCCSCSEHNRYRGYYGQKNSDSVDDRVRRLESDKESLHLQVTVLSEQIAAQTEKINDLERLLGEKRTLLANAEELLQREMLNRSSLETQKLELMSTVSEARLRQAALERENLELRNCSRTTGTQIVIANGAARRPSHSPSPTPSPASSMMHHNARDNPPRTPPATYRRLVSDQSPHSYSSLPRGSSLASSPATPRSGAPLETAVVLRSVGFAEKDTIIGTSSSPILGKVSSGNKGWGSLFKGGSGGALEDITDGDALDPFQRGGVRATAAPRLQSTQFISNRWSTIPIKEWDAEVSCEWLESLGLDCYNADAKKWLVNQAGNKGLLATASSQQIEKELNLKNPLHKKKIVLALQDIQGTSSDPFLAAAGRLDSSWALRWLEDAGLPQYREAWTAAQADGRVLHRLCHEDLHSLKVTSQLHALSLRRGIQVLRENNFSPDTMIRRGTNNDGIEGVGDLENGHVSRWSSHRVMEWLRAVDLSEYAPNLRGAGVHGGLMYYEVRFTGELLATLLNIPPSKTLLRRHLNTRFNQLLGKEVIQEKREAEQTLGYQPLTLTSKVKIIKKGQFTLKRKKVKNEAEYGDLVCPVVDQASGEQLSTTKTEISGGEVAAVCRTSDDMSNSTDSPLSQRSDHSRS